MATRASVQGLIEKRSDYREMVFNKGCGCMKEILESVELALEEGSTTVIIRRIQRKRS